MSTIDDHEIVDAEPSRGYGLSGQIMLTAIVLLFVVVVLMVGIHLYARWYIIRLRRRQLERRLNRRSTRTHVVLYADNHRPTVDRGLEPAVLKTLPVLIHSSESDRCQPECAVCLSEFEDNEVMRLLPKCNHSFHMECIDMWFHSHSTCPLCRAPVEPVVERNEPVEVELCATCQECEDDCTTSSFRGVGKGFEVRVDVATRRVELENELTQSSPTSRMLSFKRILSMGIRSPVGSRVTTPCRAGTSRGIGEVDLESGLRESTRVPTTPR